MWWDKSCIWILWLSFWIRFALWNSALSVSSSPLRIKQAAQTGTKSFLPRLPPWTGLCCILLVQQICWQLGFSRYFIFLVSFRSFLFCSGCSCVTLCSFTCNSNRGTNFWREWITNIHTLRSHHIIIVIVKSLIFKHFTYISFLSVLTLSCE